MNLQLVKTENFNDLSCDFYSSEDDIWMTRNQIGEALEYADPRKAIQNIHDKNKNRFVENQVSSKRGRLMEGIGKQLYIMNWEYLKYVD